MKSKICLLLLLFLNLFPLMFDKCGEMQAQSLGSEWDTDGGDYVDLVVTGNKPTPKPITPPSYYNYDIDGGDYVDVEVIGHYGGGGTVGGSGTGGASGSGYGTGGNSTQNIGNNKYKNCTQIDTVKLSKAIHEAVEQTKKQYKTNAACNIGVQNVAQSVLGFLPPELRGQANDIAKQLQKSKDFINVSKANAKEYANNRCLVIAVWQNSNGSGHVVIARPSDGLLLVMDTGPGDGSKAGTPGKRESQSINYSFGRDKRNYVQYYVYKGK